MPACMFKRALNGQMQSHIGRHGAARRLEVSMLLFVVSDCRLSEYVCQNISCIKHKVFLRMVVN